MNARVYMPSTGKFLTADTLVPDPKSSQSYNRYAYVHNNPINLTDPSGHKPCIRIGIKGYNSDDFGDGGCVTTEDINQEIPSHQFDPQTGFHGRIQNWYPRANSQMAIANSRLVLRWLKSYEGDDKWWDEDESGMPSERDIAAWLLDQEGGTTINDPKALRIMARIIRYRLRNGLTAEALAGFTAFFNPNGGVDFTELDWGELMKAPTQRSREIIDEIYNMSEDEYVVRDANGEPVLYWWTSDEDDAIIRDADTYYSATYYGDETIYFGSYSQCRAANAPPCR